MYYEEKIIDGILHWRSTPTGEWIAKTSEQLTSRIAELEAIMEQQATIIRDREDEIAELEAAQAQAVPDVDWLSNVIRTVDGENKLGAGALAEKIIEALAATTAPAGSQQEHFIVDHCEFVRPREQYKITIWSDCKADARTKLYLNSQPPAAPTPAGSKQSEPVKYEVQNIFGGWVEISKTMFDSWDVGDGLNKRALYEQPPAANAAQDDGWLPIETAPKDGSCILLFRPNTQFVGYYGGGYSGWHYNAHGLPSIWPLPTHWQPLPPTPAKREG